MFNSSNKSLNGNGSIKAVKGNESVDLFTVIENDISAIQNYYYNRLHSIKDVLSSNVENLDLISIKQKENKELRTSQKGLIGLLSGLRTKLISLKEIANRNKEEAISKLQSIDIIHTNFGLMYEPLKRFSNNIIKLQDLFKNINLTNSSLGKNIKGFSEEETRRLHSILQKVNSAIPFFEENIYNIQMHAKKHGEEFSCMQNKCFDLMECIIDKASLSSQDLTNYYSSIMDKEINNKIKTSLSKTKEICNWISLLLNDNSNLEKTSPNGQNGKIINGATTNYNFQNNITTFTDIEYAKLLIYNKSIDLLVKSINNQLNELNAEILNIEANNFRFFNADSECQKESKYLSGVFNDIIEQTKNFLSGSDVFNKEVEVLNKVTSHLFERFHDIDMLENSIEQLVVKKISEEGYLINPEDSISSQAQEVLKIYADNHFIKNKIKKIFEATNEELRQINAEDSSKPFNKRNLETLNKHANSISISFAQCKLATTQIIFNSQSYSELTSSVLTINREIIYKLNDKKHYEAMLKKVIEKIRLINPNYYSAKEEFFNNNTCCVNEIEKKVTMKFKSLLKKDVNNKEFFNQINFSRLLNSFNLL